MSGNEHAGAFPNTREGTLCLSSAGLTKREYFAAAAMQGLLAGGMEYRVRHDIARHAVAHAAALFAALEGR